MKTKRLLLPLLVVLSVFTGCSDDDPNPVPADTPITVTESELKEAFYYTFPLMIMDATESVETNAETFVPGIPRAPVNQLIHAVKMADASNKSEVFVIIVSKNLQKSSAIQNISITLFSVIIAIVVRIYLYFNTVKTQ